MKERNADAVVAMDRGAFAGLFTARDVLTRVIGAARDAGTTRITDALSGDSPFVDIDTTVGTTLALMNERRCDHVAVTGDGRVLGVLSRSDLDADDPRPAGAARLRDPRGQVHGVFESPGIAGPTRAPN